MKTEKWDLYFTKSQGAKTPHLRCQTEVRRSVPKTEKYEKPLTKIKKMLKNYENKTITLSKLRNGTCILLYLKVPKHTARHTSISVRKPQHRLEST